jgi:hypothetical protein
VIERFATACTPLNYLEAYCFLGAKAQLFIDLSGLFVRRIIAISLSLREKELQEISRFSARSRITS